MTRPAAFRLELVAKALLAVLSAGAASGQQPAADPEGAQRAPQVEEPDQAADPSPEGGAQRTSINLLGETSSESGESRRNENVQFNLVDNNALKELNIRLGTTATLVSEFAVDRGYFGSEYGKPPTPPVHVAPAPGRGFHGDAFWRHNNSVFSARSFFQVGEVRPARENLYGLNLAAPLGPLGAVTLGVSQNRIRGNVNGNVLIPLPEERTAARHRSRHARRCPAHPRRLPRGAAQPARHRRPGAQHEQPPEDQHRLRPHPAGPGLGCRGKALAAARLDRPECRRVPARQGPESRYRHPVPFRARHLEPLAVAGHLAAALERLRPARLAAPPRRGSAGAHHHGRAGPDRARAVPDHPDQSRAEPLPAGRRPAAREGPARDHRRIRADPPAVQRRGARRRAGHPPVRRELRQRPHHEPQAGPHRPADRLAGVDVPRVPQLVQPLLPGRPLAGHRPSHAAPRPALRAVHPALRCHRPDRAEHGLGPEQPGRLGRFLLPPAGRDRRAAGQLRHPVRRAVPRHLRAGPAQRAAHRHLGPDPPGPGDLPLIHRPLQAGPDRPVEPDRAGPGPGGPLCAPVQLQLGAGAGRRLAAAGRLCRQPRPQADHHLLPQSRPRGARHGVDRPQSQRAAARPGNLRAPADP